ncbi:MAG: hypothetical protein CL694_08455 [Chloroflexi bacterium]|nr:hypothetical protein [Chloroflexota bacterium]HAL47582.1 hypothetical protein [Dehalococcoidia bacterium]
MQRVRLFGFDVGRDRRCEREELVEHVVAVFGVLAESLVELTAHATRDVRDEPVERFPALFVEVEVVVHIGAQIPTGL